MCEIVGVHRRDTFIGVKLLFPFRLLHWGGKTWAESRRRNISCFNCLCHDHFWHLYCYFLPLCHLPLHNLWLFSKASTLACNRRETWYFRLYNWTLGAKTPKSIQLSVLQHNSTATSNFLIPQFIFASALCALKCRTCSKFFFCLIVKFPLSKCYLCSILLV